MDIKIKLIILAISIPLIIYLWPSAFGGDTEFMIVQGESMLPTILPGSFIVIKEASSYQIDDIVAFTQKSGRLQKTVVHRIIDETEQGFVIKGDNNARKDVGFPTADDIRGKVLFATPYVGDLLGMLRNPMVLIVTAVVIGVVQTQQKRVKAKKERIRRIRLGLPPKSKSPSDDRKKKPKKPNYSLFFGAMAFNVITYIAVQFSIASKIIPQGDMVTGFMFGIFEQSFASTLSFSLYSLMLLGLYFAAKSHESRSYKTNLISSNKGSKSVLVQKKSNTILSVASFVWILFILMSLFHLMAIATDLATVLN